MAELKVPSLGMDMSEATIVRWLVGEGDEVEKGDPVLEIDTDKTSFEVEATETGVIRSIAGDEGETIPVGALLAHILAPGEEPPEKTVASPEPEAPEPKDVSRRTASEKASPSPVSATPEGDTRKSAGEDAPGSSAPEDVSTNSAGGETPASHTSGAKVLRASPAARRAAKERGLELSEVPGSGPNGRVYLSDVMNFEAPETEAEATATAADAAANGSGSAPADVLGGPGTRRESLSQIRRIGAERTQRSFAEVPHFYLRRDLDAEGLVELRDRLKTRLDPAPSLNDLVSFAVARTLEHHPRLNARFDSPGELVMSEDVNLGVAAATERGLLVPVVKGANKLRLRDLATKTRELFGKARSGKLGRDELSGGTFTVSNLGMMGVDSFDAIINQPEAAILAVGRLRTAPEWHDGEWFPKWVVSATLSVDHRVADGADGARFLADLQEAITNWELLA